MKGRLMYLDRDFAVPPLPRLYRDPEPSLEWYEHDLLKDLELTTVLNAMSRGDAFLNNVGRTALLSGVRNDIETILYRQDILKDALANATVVREIYGLATETLEKRGDHYFGIFMRSPGSILRSSVGLMKVLMEMLWRLRAMVDLHSASFRSRGFTTMFALLRGEFKDEYFATVNGHLNNLDFKNGVLATAHLGNANRGTGYLLRQPPEKRANWLRRLLGDARGTFTFYLHPRDEAGARYVSELSDRSVNHVANALGQATEHILSFFQMLRIELAFYVCCLNLRESLVPFGTPFCFPLPKPTRTRAWRCTVLNDISLSLSMQRPVIPNSIDAYGKSLVIVTGANQGGKTSFVRAAGVAQLMMQSGMFVAAESFEAELCTGMFTHYKREEDASMRQGKLDEELSRMSGIADVIKPGAMVFFNESFAATNEREGSEIARQIISALLEKDMRIFFVTHLYDFAESVFQNRKRNALFLRAERNPDGTRTFKILPGAPLETSFGEDLYRKLFEKS
jgi:hypothetical protein